VSSTAPDTTERLAELRKAATPGPWMSDHGNMLSSRYANDITDDPRLGMTSDADGAFIVDLVNAYDSGHLVEAYRGEVGETLKRLSAYSYESTDDQEVDVALITRRLATYEADAEAQAGEIERLRGELEAERKVSEWLARHPSHTRVNDDEVTVVRLAAARAAVGGTPDE
jgi:hypothetical protein